jgi:hypothetical protein
MALRTKGRAQGAKLDRFLRSAAQQMIERTIGDLMGSRRSN